MKTKLTEKTNSADCISLGVIKTKLGLWATSSQQSKTTEMRRAVFTLFLDYIISFATGAAATSKTQIYCKLVPVINLFTAV